ncbi:MAG: hypothetical protein HYR76_11315 [Ignavibacteria bacterium]|nr:hypothetical protein [Ignavibacteria bacterium]
MSLICLLCGCYYFGKDQYDDILTRPSSEWSRLECHTIIAAAMQSNLFDQNANVRVFATPYYPSVITAISRRKQKSEDWNELQYRENMDQLLKDCLGMYSDWNTNVLVDGRGNFFKDRSQIDSLMFLVSMENKSENWNTNQPYLAKAPFVDGSGTSVTQSETWYGKIFELKNYPVFIPDLTALENKIFLLNEKGKFIRPLRVFREPQPMLSMNETFLVLFRLRQDDYHFLAGSEKMFLVFKGLGNDIQLSFPLSMMR